MGEQTGKILRTMIITLVVLALIAGGIIYAVVNSSENLILGTWEAENEGTTVTYLFTDEFENPSTKETLYYLTVKNPDGTTEQEKGTYNISNDSVITFRPVDENIKDSATAAFTIKDDKLTCLYTIDFEEREVVFTKTADYEKKDK